MNLSGTPDVSDELAKTEVNLVWSVLLNMFLNYAISKYVVPAFLINK